MPSLNANSVFNAVESGMNSASKFANKAGVRNAWGVSKELARGMHLKSGGAAMGAIGGGIVGGGAGYAYDGDSRGVLKGAAAGAALGVLGVGGMNLRSAFKGGGLGEPRAAYAGVRGAMKDARGSVSSMYNNARGSAAAKAMGYSPFREGA